MIPPIRTLIAGALLATLACQAAAQAVPAPGTSARIDAIKKSGVLRAAVLSNPPWLVENTTGSGDAWAGPAWLLAVEAAKQLGVKLQPVPVSHETKVPVLASNQADMTISPLSVTPERLKVVDFVTYSRTALCVFGRADNPKVANAKSIDEFNSPDVTVAYFTGGGEENWVKKRFPNAKLRGVSTAGTAAPVEEIMAKRADVTPINRVPWQALNRKVKGLKALPDGNNCQDSTEMATPIGLAIDKNQPEYLAWLKALNESMKAKLDADEARIINAM
ncbi:transporter substrate-binding domain-containing protein [Variovorax sp. dw_954]|uniref:substrate-binding periplasmic protein n=1 Tax=Variovorax sp. dw_954 TaxID=2720078 RepID=UPI001BD20FF6|nr:transporter substrate-binding domain-containing protein [Variovorax sp. dw_954]